VLFVTSILGGKNHGGAEISMRLLLRSLTAKNLEVKALTTRRNVNDAQLVSISFPIEIPKQLLTLGNSLNDYFLSRKISNKIDEIKPDVLHVQDTYILPATVSANQRKIPIVATIRNSVLDETWEMMFPKPISTILKRRNKAIIKALSDVDCVISVSEYIKTELIQRGISSKKIVCIYNLPPTFTSYNLLKSRKTDSKIHLFAPGFLASFKGFTTLIQAMKKIVKSNPNVELTIAGDGPQRKTLEKMVKKLKLEHYVVFAGNVHFGKLAEYYTKCDIVVFPSIYAEPFGRVGLEAMYFSKPVVASRVGGIPEVVKDGEAGLLVPSNAPDELAEAILKLAGDPDLRVLMGKKGSLIINETFSEEDILQKHLEIYSEIKLKL